MPASLTLLDQSALDDLLPACAEGDVSVVIGGILISGLLASPGPGSYFDYAPASRERIAQALDLEEVRRRYSAPLKAAASNSRWPTRRSRQFSPAFGGRSIWWNSTRSHERTSPRGDWSDLRYEGSAPARGSNAGLARSGGLRSTGPDQDASCVGDPPDIRDERILEIRAIGNRLIDREADGHRRPTERRPSLG